MTILIGRNGSGKSTVLRDLTNAMREYFSGRPRSRRGSGRVVGLKIESDGHLDVLDRSEPNGRLFNERSLARGRGKGPSKIIALSFTPFDKFPINVPGNRKGSPNESANAYVYLGFKGSVRNSPRALLRQSIDQLALAASSPIPDQRVAGVLAAIGYRPVLTINYQLNRLHNVLASEHINRERVEAQMADLQPLLQAGPGRTASTIPYRFDFAKGHAANFASNKIEYDTLRQLVRANVLRMISATLERQNGDEVELLDLSSGELNLLSGFLGLAANLEDGCVVLIDEPENSLHPEWQLSYVEMLDAVLKSRSGCHYVLATHSPLIVSGFAGRGCAILRLDQEPVRVKDDVVANTSPDATLVSAFNVLTPDNNYLKQLVLEALTLIEQGLQDEDRAQQIAEFLASFQDSIPSSEPLADLVRNVCLAILH
ncbi:ATP-binding protein [Frateuria edaphi]|uniref:ATP-binding protein n=1 Tax=Frateuria edaphi TaxID=2898793 RepID=UPI001E3590C3|nr:ATP-binding protein [Frateuria edaphi]UGB47237.1 ATP-binding protein [Frateuria edaphi]